MTSKPSTQPRAKAGSAKRSPRPTKPSTPRLSEAARYLVVPKDITTTGWPAVRETCLRLKITFDPWQDGAGNAILGKRKDGLYAADAVVLSIPRQVGKTFLVGAIVIALCLIHPSSLAVWTAHHGSTASDTFRDLKAMVAVPEIKAYVKSVYDSGSRQEIIFTNKSRILFGAREHGFGRGFKKVAILIFDEAQILTARAADDMVPTTNRHPNPLIFYMGTPPKPSDPSEHFLSLRTEAIDGESTDTFYLEFSADPDADLNDREQWAKANPSYPVHTTARAMMRMKKNLKGPNAFAREGLGIWDGTAKLGVFSTGAWSRCRTTEEPALPEALGVAADVDQTWLSLGAYGADHVGARLRMRFDQQREQFVAEVARIATEHHLPVAIGKRGFAAPIIEDLEALNVQVIASGTDDYVQACADFRNAVETHQITHGDYEELNAAVDAAAWRKSGDQRVFDRRSGDISMLEAVTLARWVAKSSDYDPLNSIA